MSVVATNNIAEVALHYTLALDGNIQRFTAAKDISGNTLDASNLLNIFVDEVHVQLSNDAGAATNKCFIGYKSGAAPTTLDKTSAMLDLVPSNQITEIPRSNAARQRGTQIRLGDLYAKGVSGDYLHIIVPRIDNIVTV